MPIATDSSGVVRGIHEVSLCENAIVVREIRDMAVALDKVVYTLEGTKYNEDAHSIA